MQAMVQDGITRAWPDMKSVLIKRFGHTDMQLVTEMWELRQYQLPITQYVDKIEDLALCANTADANNVPALKHGLNRYFKSQFVVWEASRLTQGLLVTFTDACTYLHALAANDLSEQDSKQDTGKGKKDQQTKKIQDQAHFTAEVPTEAESQANCIQDVDV